jgi:uncharacterized membrane protein
MDNQFSPQGSPHQPPAQGFAPQAAGSGQPNGLMVFLSYFGIFGLIPYISQGSDPFIKWHAKQGLTYTCSLIVAAIGLAIVNMILGFIPFIGWLIGMVLGLGFLVVSVTFWLKALLPALRGEQYRIPFVADLADKW